MDDDHRLDALLIVAAVIAAVLPWLLLIGWSPNSP